VANGIAVQTPLPPCSHDHRQLRFAAQLKRAGSPGEGSPGGRGHRTPTQQAGAAQNPNHQIIKKIKYRVLQEKCILS